MASVATSTATPASSFEKVEMNVHSPKTFNPAIHMTYEAPEEVYTLKDLDISPEGAISPVAITAPFRLFSDEGIREIRKDLFRKEMLEKHMFTERKDPGVYKLRGYGKDAPFVYSAWTNEALLKACSEAAGCELEVVFDYEIGHTNVQLPPAKTDSGKIEDLLPPAVPPKQHAIVSDEVVEAADKANITAWHNDSYPWVCVCMLSDPTGMVGGETAMRKGDGEIMKVRGPQIGSAVMMQGGLINHVALKSHGSGERITLVTSFRPKDPLAHDMSNLGNVKKVSDHTQLYKQWTSYRTEVAAKRAQAFARKVKDGNMSPEELLKATDAFTKDQIDYMKTTVMEMTEGGNKGNYNY